ncbi:hypothetical protein [Streptomyces sp. 6N223]
MNESANESANEPTNESVIGRWSAFPREEMEAMDADGGYGRR